MQTCGDLNLEIDTPLADINNRYTVLNKLGEGSFGRVYRVVDNHTNDVVSMKILPVKKEYSLTEATHGCRISQTVNISPSLVYPINIGLVKEFPVHDPVTNKLISYRQDKKITLKKKKFKLFPDNPHVEGLVLIYPLLYLSSFGENYEDLKDFIFEMAVAIIALQSIRLTHNDIYLDNILYKRSDETRLYTVDGIQYLVKSKSVPVLIDYGQVLPFEDIDESLKLIRKYDFRALRDLVVKTTVRSLKRKDQILLGEVEWGPGMISSEFFSPLRNRVITGGETLKVFEPINTD